MKVFKYIMLLCFLAVLTACSEDAFVPQSEEIPATDGGSVDLISMTVPDIQMEDASTRSLLYEDGEELKFAWEENDAIGVVPLSGFPVKFPINAENAGKNTAVFDGGDWALKSSGKYAAFFPYNREISDKDIKSIPIDYTGQTQINYMDYDFLATGAIQPSNGEIKFNMKRLSAILKFEITMDANTYGRFGRFYVSPEKMGVKGVMDLSGTTPVFVPSEYSNYIETDLLTDDSHAESWTYEAYMLIPPVDMTDKTIVFRISSNKSDNVYEAEIEGKNFEAGKAYKLEGVAEPARIKNLNLIAAAKNTADNPGVSFSYSSDGTINVNDNLSELKKVVKINVLSKDDPTVCDEIIYFPNLQSLNCARNNLTSLDISKNPKLQELTCGTNSLTSLDVSNNTELITLYCRNNQLTSLDLSNNTSLEDLSVGNNTPLFSRIDGLSNCTALKYLACIQTGLTELDVSNFPELLILQIQNSQLTSLDVSKNTKLETLSCNSNLLTSLDVSKNTELVLLRCSNNQISSLTGLNKCPVLEELYCHNNQLTSLDVSSCPLISWENLYCGLQHDNAGNYQYIVVEGNDLMLEYYFDNGTIPSCSSSSDPNYYVKYEGGQYP